MNKDFQRAVCYIADCHY